MTNSITLRREHEVGDVKVTFEVTAAITYERHLAHEGYTPLDARQMVLDAAEVALERLVAASAAGDIQAP